MSVCRDIEPLIVRYVDEEATAGERNQVDTHAGECAACRRRVADEAAARLVLRTRADAMRVDAPAGLRAWCERTARRSRPRPALLRMVWPAIPAARYAMAALVLLVIGGIVMSGGRGSRVLAAELALDHIKCFTLFENSSGPADTRAIAARFEAAYGWRLRVPDAQPVLGLRLVGGRRCFSTDGRIAHILYRHDGRPVSLFAMPSTGRQGAQLAVLGHQAIIWSSGGTTFAVLGREPMSELAGVAAYMKRAME